MALAAILAGAHCASPVTALAWCPGALGGRDPASGLPLPPRLVSGDAAGRLVAWDVRSRTPFAVLADPVLAATGSSARAHHSPPDAASSSSTTAIRALAWAGGDADAVFALAGGGGLALAWDVRGGGVAWARPFDAGLGLASLAADPCDRRRVAAYGPASGHVVCIALPSTSARRASDAVVSSFRVGGGGGGGGGGDIGLSLAFSPAGDALVLACPREITLYDLERGALAPPAAVPRGGLGPVAAILATPRRRAGVGEFGGGEPPSSPLDLLHLWHGDGSVSAWARAPGAASYALLSVGRTAPAGGGGLATPRTGAGAVVAVAAAERRAVWTGGGGAPAASSPSPSPSSSSSSSSTSDDEGGAPPASEGEDALLILAVDDAGGIAKWSLPLSAGLAREAAPPLPPPPPPPAPARPPLLLPLTLEAVLHTPAPGITCLDACPAPVLSSAGGVGQAAAAILVAAGGGDGTVWLAALARGACGAPLGFTPGAAVAAHAAGHPVRGVAWVGAGPALVSFTSSAWDHEGGGGGGGGGGLGGGEPPPSPSAAPASSAPGAPPAAASNEVCLIDARTRTVARLAPPGLLLPGGTGNSAGAAGGGVGGGGGGGGGALAAFPPPPPPPARAPVLAARPSPSGRYLAILLRGAPAELWDLGGPGPPSCVRTVDLPFVDAAWVGPGGAAPAERSLLPLCDAAGEGGAATPRPSSPSSPPPPPPPPSRRPWRAAWARGGDGAPPSRSPSPVRTISDALQDGGKGGEAAAAAAAAPRPAAPAVAARAGAGGQEVEASSFERLAFALADGRVGVLRCAGGALTDDGAAGPAWGGRGSAGPPASSPLPPSGPATTAVAAWGRTVILGDVDGGLHAWNVDTGAVSSSPGGGAGGLGSPVRALVAAPPPPAALAGGGAFFPGVAPPPPPPPDPRRPPLPPLPTPSPRIAALFADGSYGVWEVVSGGSGGASSIHPVLPRTHLLGGSPYASPPASSTPPAADIGWAPLPPPVGGGAVLLLAGRQRGGGNGSPRSLPGGPLLALDVATPALPPARGGGPLAQASAAASATPGARAAAFRALLSGGGGAAREGEAAQPPLLPLPPPPNTPRLVAATPLAPPPALGSATLLPPAWRALLALILQGGIEPAALKEAAAAAPGPAADAALETALWAALPPGSAAAWAGGLSPGAPRPVARLSSATDQEVAYLSHGEREWLRPSTSSADGLLGGGVGLAAPPPTQPEGAAAAPAAPVPGPATDARLASAVRLLARARAGGRLLTRGEWAAYGEAASAPSPAARAAVAAAAGGCAEEAAFWGGLPTQLAAWAADSGVQGAAAAATKPSPALPWTPAAAVAASRERSEWHAPAPPPPPGSSPQPRARGGGGYGRGPPSPSPPPAPTGTPPTPHDLCILERVALGDRATAVGLLLAAAAPGRSARQYREALCAVALAAAPDAGGATAPPTPPLLAQACKVAAANAAAAGDGLAGAPLLLAAGLPCDAAACLADAGLWRLAVTLACTAVPPGRDRAGALDRYAAYVEREAGAGWAGAGVRVASGGVCAASAALAAAGAPDAAACLLEAAAAAGVGDADGGQVGRRAGDGGARARHAAGVVGAL